MTLLCRPLSTIGFCNVGHGTESDFAVSVTVQTEPNSTLSAVAQTLELCTVGPEAGSAYELRLRVLSDIAQNQILRCRPKCRIRFCAVGRSAKP
jgi:hypothetical protein